MKIFTITRTMWEEQKSQEEFPVIWFYYYYMLKKHPSSPFVGQADFERLFSVYVNNLIYEMKFRKPEVDVYEALLHLVFTYFEENLPND